MHLLYPQIDWGGAGPGFVETEFQLLTWLTAAVYLLLGEHVWIGRLISVAFALVAVAAFCGLARRLLVTGGRRGRRERRRTGQADVADRGTDPARLAAGRPRYSQNSPQYHIYALPFAALLVGLGAAAAAEWARPGWPRVARRAAAAVIVAAFLAGSVTVFAGSLRDTSGTLGVCATELDEVSGPGDLVVVDTTSTAVDRTPGDNGVPNNWQEPVVFYRADRRGWSLAADQLDQARLAADQQAGARFLVDVDPALVPAGSPLAGWLAANATPVRTPVADGCGIWALR